MAKTIPKLEWFAVKREWFAVSCITLLSSALIAFNFFAVDHELSPVILYTASSEMEHFHHVSKLEYTSLTQFLKDTGNDSDDAKALVVLCGDDGAKCPQVSSNGETDDFEFKPMNEEQARVWEKWLALKDRVADLEGILKNMMKKPSSRSV
jgi:hypothetical protein